MNINIYATAASSAAILYHLQSNNNNNGMYARTTKSYATSLKLQSFVENPKIFQHENSIHFSQKNPKAIIDV